MFRLCLIVVITSLLCSRMTALKESKVPVSDQYQYKVQLSVVFSAITKNDPNLVTLEFSKDGKISALDALKKAQNRDCYNFEYKVRPYPSSTVITAMCGIKNDAAKHYEWVFFVNGVEQQTSVSNYILQEEDRLEMKYVDRSQA